tara:strand:+ start:1866 stop:2159 length:294 start_codon:yes stop_codon:yes gene_type:complete
VEEVHADRDPLALAAGDAADLLVPHDGVRGRDQPEVGDDVFTSRSFSSRGMSLDSRSCAANMSVSRTVLSANRASSCSTYALILAIFDGVSTSLPSA